MILVIDTHVLVWFLRRSVRLSDPALAAIQDQGNQIIVPTMVLAEIRYLYAKNRIPVSLDEVLAFVEGDARVSIHELNIEIVQSFPIELDIHDAIICGTAIVLQRSRGEEVRVVTVDRRIRDSGVVETLW